MDVKEDRRTDKPLVVRTRVLVAPGVVWRKVVVEDRMMGVMERPKRKRKPEAWGDPALRGEEIPAHVQRSSEE